MIAKPVIETVNPFVKVMQNKVPEYKGICSLLSIKRPYSSKYSKDIFPRFVRYFINSKCLKISMKEYENLVNNKYMSVSRAKKCDHSIKVLLDSTHLTFPAIMIALGYISKLRRNTITSSLLHHQNNSEVKILTLSLMASMKAHYDNVYSNKSWSTVSGIPLRELNILESNFLRDINFDLFINERIFFDYMDRVENSLKEYYETISNNENKNENKNNTETFENSNIPSKEIHDSRNFKRNSVNLTPAPSPKDNNNEDKISDSYNSLNVPENKYKSNKSVSSSPSENNYKSPIYKQGISTPSIYSTESSFSSELSELNLPQNKNNNAYDNEKQNSNQSIDSKESNSKDFKHNKKSLNLLNQSNNNYINNGNGKSNIMNTKLMVPSVEENQQNLPIKSRSTKYNSSTIPSFLHKYQQKVENGEYLKYLDDLDANAKENTGKKSSINKIISNEELHSSPLNSSKVEVSHSLPVPIIKNSGQHLHSKDKGYYKNDTQQHYIPKRTSSNNLHQFIPKKMSSTNLNAQYRESNNEYTGNIKQSNSISIAYQTKPNQQMVDSSNQLFRHKTVSLTYPVATTTTVTSSSMYANYPQGQYAIPLYKPQVAYTNQNAVQQIYPYYVPQNSSQIGVIIDTNIVQQPIPIRSNSTILQAQPLPPNPIPSPISPQPIVYSNGITICHQNSYQSNYTATSPYVGSVISTPVNTNVYYSAENNLTTPVHILSSPPIINPINNYPYNTNSQEHTEFNNVNNYSKSKEKISDSNFDRLSKKSYNSINDNSSYDSVYNRDLEDNNCVNNEGENGTSGITKRSNTIGSSQNIRNELKNNGQVPNQFLHPSYSYIPNNNYGYDNGISRSNSYNFENNITRSNTYSNETNISVNSNRSISYDNNVRKGYPNDIYRNNSYDSTSTINPNVGYYDPSLNYSYISSSYPVINGIYRSNSYASSSSSMINDNGSYYSNNKRLSHTSSYYKKKQNGIYSTEHKYVNDDKSKPFYRSKSVNNKNYRNNNNIDNNNNNNNNNKGPINRSRSYSHSHKYKNGYNKNTNNNNYMKDNKSKLNNISTLSTSEGNTCLINNNKDHYSTNNEINKKIDDINIKEIENNKEESVVNVNFDKKDCESKSKTESETYVASIKTNNESNIDKHDDKDQKSETIDVDSNTYISNQQSPIYNYNEKTDNANNNNDDINNETDESSESEDNKEDVFSNNNPDIYSKKINDIESRRYSSISTYNLDNLDKDNQSFISKKHKYRYSDCNFESFDYDSSFHIENIKNDLMDNNNNKLNDTILSINSNKADADFISERESTNNTEEGSNNYKSSISENNNEKIDSNINFYVNHEDIESVKSYVSSLDDYYDRKSEINKKEILNTSFSSKETYDNADNHILLNKVPRSTNANMIKFGLKKVLRANSTPIYSNSENYINEDESWDNGSNQNKLDKYKNLPESRQMEKITNITSSSNGHQEPKIIKMHGSKKSGIKKTMSLILESGSKIFNKKQNQQSQNQNQSQSKGKSVNTSYCVNKELPPIPTDKELLENAKDELKSTKKKHHSSTHSTSIGSHLLLKLDRDASFATSSSFSKPGSIHYVEPGSINKTN